MENYAPALIGTGGCSRVDQMGYEPSFINGECLGLINNTRHMAGVISSLGNEIAGINEPAHCKALGGGHREDPTHTSRGRKPNAFYLPRQDRFPRK